MIAILALHLIGFLPNYFWHPLGQCTAASSNHVVAMHEIIRCKSYNLWSGIVSDISEIAIVGGLITIVLGLWHHVNCHEHGCLRLSWHKDADGHPICKKHHPDHPSNGFWWDLKHFVRTGHWGNEKHPRHNVEKARRRASRDTDDAASAEQSAHLSMPS